MVKKLGISKEAAEKLIQLLQSADGYLRHPNVESILGFQTSQRAVINIDEVIWYLKDHVLDEDAEGLTKRDRTTIAGSLQELAVLLARPAISQMFAPGSDATAQGLYKSAKSLRGAK